MEDGKWSGKRCDMCGGRKGTSRGHSVFCAVCVTLLIKYNDLWRAVNVRV